MSTERIVRIFAGSFVLASLAPGVKSCEPAVQAR